MRHRRKLSFITCMHSFTQITSRIELRGIVPSNQIKVTFIIILFYPSAWFVFFFFSVSHRNWRKMWVDYLGGGGGGWPLSNYWVGLPLPPPLFLCLWSTWTTKQWTPNKGRHPIPPLPTPMKHLNNKTMDTKHRQIQKEYLLKEDLIYKEKKN